MQHNIDGNPQNVSQDNFPSSQLSLKAFSAAGSSQAKSKALKLLDVIEPHEEKVMLQKQIDENSWKAKKLVFSDGNFTKWQVGEDQPVLWIHGEDGLGKTPLTMALISELRNHVERSSKNREMAYCICSTQVSSKKTVSSMIRSLFHQVLCRQPEDQTEVFNVLLDAYERDNNIISSSDASSSLWKILLQTLEAAKIQVASFLLYRPEESNTNFPGFFPELMKATDVACAVKWVVISRIGPKELEGITSPLAIDLASIPDDKGGVEPLSGLMNGESNSSSTISLRQDLDAKRDDFLRVRAKTSSAQISPMNLENLATV